MTMRVLSYRNGSTHVVTPTCAEIEAQLSDPEVNLWIDVFGRSGEAEKLLLEVLKLHPLVVEDVFEDRQVPKIEDYGEYVYVIVHGIDRRTQAATEPTLVELDIVIGARFVLTHHTESMRSIDAVAEELDRNPRLLVKGSSFLAHSILDHLTDHFVPLMDQFDEDIEDLEQEIFTNPQPKHLARIFALKNALQKIRRVSVRQKEILHRLSRGEFELIAQGALPFFRDVFDHFQRISDLVDSYREITQGALEVYLGMQSQKLNEVMKVLTVISTIMLPLTFVAGIYGMNFEFMPELHWKWGYPFALSIMAIITVGLVIVFKKKRVL